MYPVMKRRHVHVIRTVKVGPWLVAALIGCASAKVWVSPNVASDEEATRQFQACRLYADGAGGTYYGGSSILANMFVASVDRNRIMAHCMEAAGYHLEDKAAFYKNRGTQPQQAQRPQQSSVFSPEDCQDAARYTDDEMYSQIANALQNKGTPVVPAEIYKAIGAVRTLCAQQAVMPAQGATPVPATGTTTIRAERQQAEPAKGDERSDNALSSELQDLSNTELCSLYENTHTVQVAVEAKRRGIDCTPANLKAE